MFGISPARRFCFDFFCANFRALPGAALLLVATHGLAAEPGLPASWLPTAQQQIVQQEYQPSQRDGTWQAPNRSQGFRSVFEKDGIRFLTRDLESRSLAKVSVSAIGRGSELVSIGAAKKVAADDGQVGMCWDGLVWRSDNGPDGLAQSLAISQKPAGSGPLVVAINVCNKDGEIELCADAVFLSELRLGGFGVVDQSGKQFAL